MLFRSPTNLIGYAQQATQAFFGKSLPVTMRTTPTSMTFSGTGTVVYGAGSSTTSSTFGSDSMTPDNVGFYVTTSSVLTTGGAIRLQTSGSLTLYISAEL